jgi:hypothetical protein
VEKNKAAAVLTTRADKQLAMVDKAVRTVLFVAQNNLPLTITSRPFFPSKMSRRTLTRNVRVVASARRAMLRADLDRRGVNNWAVGFDGSTTKSMKTVQAVSVYYLDDDFQHGHHSLGVIESGGRTGANIAAVATEMLEEFGRGLVVVNGVVTDGASSERLAGRLVGGETGDTSVVCTAHTLQLVVNAGLAVPRVAEAVKRIHTLCVAIRRSKVLRSALVAAAAAVRNGRLGATLSELLAMDDGDDDDE